MNKDRPALATTDSATHQAQLRAAEEGNPHSTDAQLASASAVTGSDSSAAFGSKLLSERSSVEKQIAELARQFHVALEQPGDHRAQNRLAADQISLQGLQQSTGAAFDRSFARLMAPQSDLEAVEVMRTKCVQEQVSSLLDQLLPVLQSDQAEAHSLSIAVCGADSC